jgi:AAA domain
MSKPKPFTVPGAVSTERELPPIVDVFDLLADRMPEPPEIIKGLLHQGSRMVIGGGSKSYKTWGLLDLGISVSTGERWWDFETVQGCVLYVNLELPAWAIRQRIEKICKAKGITIPSRDLFKILNLRGHSARMAVLRPKLEKAMAGTVYSLSILDPSYKLMPGGDESGTGDVSNLLAEIEVFAVNTKAGVAFGSHFSKGNQSQKESIDRISGSGLFARDPDSIVTLTKHQEEKAFTVEPVLRLHPPVEPFVIRWAHPLFVRDELLDPTRLKEAGRKKPKVEIAEYLTLFSDDFKIDPMESVLGVRELRAKFVEKKWPRELEPGLREQALRLGFLDYVDGKRGALHIGKPKVIEALRTTEEFAKPAGAKNGEHQ